MQIFYPFLKCTKTYCGHKLKIINSRIVLPIPLSEVHPFPFANNKLQCLVAKWKRKSLILLLLFIVWCIASPGAQETTQHGIISRGVDCISLLSPGLELTFFLIAVGRSSRRCEIFRERPSPPFLLPFSPSD